MKGFCQHRNLGSDFFSLLSQLNKQEKNNMDMLLFQESNLCFKWSIFSHGQYLGSICRGTIMSNAIKPLCDITNISQQVVSQGKDKLRE